MEVTVIGKHIDITDPIRDYARDKSSRLPKFYDRVSSVEVVADRHDRHGFKVEIIAHVDGRDPFIASGTGDDMYACIDQTVDRMERQLHDYKAKLRDNKH